MQGKWKVLIGVVGVAVIAGGVFASIRYSQRDIVTVQTGKVIQEDLASVVTASGTINPKTYINIGAQYQGQITDIYVKEGDHVRLGELLAKVDSAQSAADVVAQQAGLSSAEADANAAEEAIKAGQDNIRTLEATLNRTKADLTRYEADFKRGEDLFKAGLIPKCPATSTARTVMPGVGVFTVSRPVQTPLLKLPLKGGVMATGSPFNVVRPLRFTRPLKLDTIVSSMVRALMVTGKGTPTNCAPGSGSHEK